MPQKEPNLSAQNSAVKWLAPAVLGLGIAAVTALFR